MAQMTTNVVTEYTEGTTDDDEVEATKTTSATVATKRMTTTMATMIMTKTLISPLHAFGAEYRFGAKCRFAALSGPGNAYLHVFSLFTCRPFALLVYLLLVMGGHPDAATLPSTQTHPAADVTMAIINSDANGQLRYHHYHNHRQPPNCELVTHAASYRRHRHLQNPYRHRQLHLCHCQNRCTCALGKPIVSIPMPHLFSLEDAAATSGANGHSVHEQAARPLPAPLPMCRWLLSSSLWCPWCCHRLCGVRGVFVFAMCGIILASFHSYAMCVWACTCARGGMRMVSHAWACVWSFACACVYVRLLACVCVCACMHVCVCASTHLIGSLVQHLRHLAYIMVGHA